MTPASTGAQQCSPIHCPHSGKSEVCQNNASERSSVTLCLLAGLTAIMWLETGSIFRSGGHRQALWDRFFAKQPRRLRPRHRVRQEAVYRCGLLWSNRARDRNCTFCGQGGLGRDKYCRCRWGCVSVVLYIAAEATPAIETNSKNGRITGLSKRCTLKPFAPLRIPSLRILATATNRRCNSRSAHSAAHKLDVLGNNVQLTNMKSTCVQLD